MGDDGMQVFKEAMEVFVNRYLAGEMRYDEAVCRIMDVPHPNQADVTVPALHALITHRIQTGE